jgi:hypothetical protein
VLTVSINVIDQQLHVGGVAQDLSEELEEA